MSRRPIEVVSLKSEWEQWMEWQRVLSAILSASDINISYKDHLSRFLKSAFYPHS